MATPTTVPLALVGGGVCHFIDRLKPGKPLNSGARCLGCHATWTPGNGTSLYDFCWNHIAPDEAS